MNMELLYINVLLVTCLVSAASALSCAPCFPEQLSNCTEPSCDKSDRVLGQCQCCEICGKTLGEKCTEKMPCIPDLKCYTLDKDPYLPFFYNGICVTKDVFESLPPEPQSCESICDQKLWEYQQNQKTTQPPTTTSGEPVGQESTTAESVPEFGERKAIMAFVSWIKNRLYKD